MAAIAVDSWPPPRVPVETNRPAYLDRDVNDFHYFPAVRVTYLPKKPPVAQIPPVRSQNAFHWAGKLP